MMMRTHSDETVEKFALVKDRQMGQHVGVGGERGRLVKAAAATAVFVVVGRNAVFRQIAAFSGGERERQRRATKDARSFSLHKKKLRRISCDCLHHS